LRVRRKRDADHRGEIAGIVLSLAQHCSKAGNSMDDTPRYM
jgi:hypothetical protein